MQPLTLARLGIALACAVEGVATGRVLLRLTEPGILHLPIAGLPDLSPDLVQLLIGLWILAAMALAAGARIAGPILAACIGYAILLDQQTYSNHLYLLAILTAILGLSDRDRDLAILALKGQLTLVYFFAALSKLNPAFLSGVVIAGSLRPALDFLRSPWILVPMALSTILVEMYIADSLWVPSRRKLAATLGVALHVSFVLLMDNTRALAMFGLACLSIYPLFWTAQDRHRQRAAIA